MLFVAIFANLVGLSWVGECPLGLAAVDLGRVLSARVVGSFAADVAGDDFMDSQPLKPRQNIGRS
jgi:hypothetical protein